MWGAARRLSLTQRVMAIVAVAIVPASAALPLFIWSIHQERAREVRDMALRTSQIAALEMERIVTGTEGVLQTMALAPAVRAFEEPGCNGYIAEVAARLPQIRGFAVADAQGQVRCVTGLTFGRTVRPGSPGSRRRWGRTPRRGRLHQTRPDEAAYLPVALPIGAPGAHSGVIVAGIDLDWLGARLRERNLAQGSALAIADGDGIIIAREPDSETYVGKQINPQVLPLVHAAGPGVEEVTGRGRKRGGSSATSRRTRPRPGSTSARASRPAAPSARPRPRPGAVLRSPWRARLPPAPSPGLVGDRLFSKPIRRILDTIASWRAGDETARTGIAPGGSELTEIATSIDEYMDSLVLARARRRRRRRAADAGAERDEPSHQEHPRRGAGGRQPDLQGHGQPRTDARLRQSAAGDGGDPRPADRGQLEERRAAQGGRSGAGAVRQRPGRTVSTLEGPPLQDRRARRAGALDGAARALHQRREVWGAFGSGGQGHDPLERSTATAFT